MTIDELNKEASRLAPVLSQLLPESCPVLKAVPFKKATGHDILSGTQILLVRELPADISRKDLMIAMEQLYTLASECVEYNMVWCRQHPFHHRDVPNADKIGVTCVRGDTGAFALDPVGQHHVDNTNTIRDEVVLENPRAFERVGKCDIAFGIPGIDDTVLWKIENKPNTLLLRVYSNQTLRKKENQ